MGTSPPQSLLFSTLKTPLKVQDKGCVGVEECEAGGLMKKRGKALVYVTRSPYVIKISERKNTEVKALQ